MRSYLDCPHHNVQQFTDYCLDCGHSTYMTKQEYLQYLKDMWDRKQNDELIGKIREYEKKLDIK
jgi:hypothetical protein